MSKGILTAHGKYFLYGHAGAPLDGLVKVDKRHAGLTGHCSAKRSLARAHVAYKEYGAQSLLFLQIDAVRLGQQVADFGEEHLFLGGFGSRGGSGCFLLLLLLELHNDLQGEEDAEGDD